MAYRCLQLFAFVVSGTVGVLAVNACGSAQLTRPTTAILPLTGTWTGTYRVTSCTPDVLIGCSSIYLSRPAYSVRLVLTQTESMVTGTFDGDVATGRLAAPIPLSGSADSSGALHLRGGQPFVDGFFPGSEQQGIDFGNWTTVEGAGGTSMSGAFHQTITAHYALQAYPLTVDFQSEIVSLTRSSAGT
jgi:hypothetical protein